jgi:AI-2E family transporter
MGRPAVRLRAPPTRRTAREPAQHEADRAMGLALRSYFVLIVVAAVGAYLFTPFFNWFDRRMHNGLAATSTLLSAVAMVIVPVGLLVFLAIVQISRMVTHVASWVKRTGLNKIGDQSLHVVNQFLTRVPFLHMTVTAESLRKTMATVAQKAGEWTCISCKHRWKSLRRRHRGHHFLVCVYGAADEPREAAHLDPPAQSARRGRHRFVPSEDGLHVLSTSTSRYTRA